MSQINLTEFTKSQDKMANLSRSLLEEYLDGNTSRISNYTLDDITQAIKNQDYIKLIKISRHFFDVDTFYSRLIRYYATVLKYTGLLIPHPAVGKKLSEKAINRRYYQALNYVSSLNLPGRLTEISEAVLINGCYYGYLLSYNKKELVILDLPVGYCRSTHKNLRGDNIIEFNLDYFSTIIDPEQRAKVLASYPPYIADRYKQWESGAVGAPWIELPTDETVFFSFPHSKVPILLGTVVAILQYVDTVDLEAKRNREEIKKVLVQEMPHTSDGTLVFEPDEVAEMHRGVVEMLKGQENTAVLTSYGSVKMEGTRLSADASRNIIPSMQQHIYAQSGTSQQIFSPTGSQALLTSIENDMATMSILARQYETFITDLLNFLYSNSNISFTYRILPISIYNQSEYLSDALKLAQSGYSYLLPCLALDISQKDLGHLKELENDLLKLRELLIPLASSHTQSGNEPGAPQKEVDEKAPKTVQNQEGE